MRTNSETRDKNWTSKLWKTGTEQGTNSQQTQIEKGEKKRLEEEEEEEEEEEHNKEKEQGQERISQERGRETQEAVVTLIVMVVVGLVMVAVVSEEEVVDDTLSPHPPDTFPIWSDTLPARRYRVSSQLSFRGTEIWTLAVH
ncbi:hypothetical protein E2C01_027747 [Portunus trituberculatus]|uniref:Uncharacterized protein n=1 Tax=Portunus trituberculatus TaxID=210409 RepID=A0A5B7EN09_PORTR|nr:hypothetical protein [Portunus trituberculatus]